MDRTRAYEQWRSEGVGRPGAKCTNGVPQAQDQDHSPLAFAQIRKLGGGGVPLEFGQIRILGGGGGGGVPLEFGQIRILGGGGVPLEFGQIRILGGGGGGGGGGGVPLEFGQIRILGGGIWPNPTILYTIYFPLRLRIPEIV